MKTIGGMTINELSTEKLRTNLLLGEKPYSYRIFNFDSSFSTNATSFYCLYFYSSSPDEYMTVDGNQIGVGEVVHVSCLEKVFSHKGNGTLFIAEHFNTTTSSGIHFFGRDQIKKVSKPWGYELWLTGESAPLAFKEICIKAGTKTSLQYHQYKRETNLVFKGVANLYYNPRPEVKASEFNSQDVAVVKLAPLTVVDVFPNYVHRLEAVTEITLLEVSTPELDDVIRISDDSNRKDGRIDSEHKK